MRIESVRVKGFRSLKDVAVELDSYVALIGANGTGKSTVLYALDWFFSGSQLERSDFHGCVDGQPLPPDAILEVAVTLVDLSDPDRARLREYGRGERAEFRRSWNPTTGATKWVGNARQGPGFAVVRAHTRVVDSRPAYQALRARQPELPDLGATPSREQIAQALADWESNPANRSSLVEVPDSDANHMFGINGPNVIRDCLQLVLVPAATNISGLVGQAGRGSALNELVGTLAAQATTAAQARWAEENAEAIASLRTKVAASVEKAVGVQQSRVNANLARFVPKATVSLTPTVPDWSPKGDASVTTAVSIDGTTTDVSRQGHGVQRAVLMAMLQAFAPDETFVRSQHQEEAEPEAALVEVAVVDESTGEASENEDQDSAVAAWVAELPSLVICIEEPELYQHPVRVRAFAKTLHELSQHSNVQVLVATHSPYLIRPEQFPSLRRFALEGGASTVTAATAASIAADADLAESKVAANVERLLPTAFSEGFFADSVVLVEGTTDSVVIGAIAELSGRSLDAAGVAVLEVGSKSAMRMAFAILNSLKVPVFLVVDGDALGGKRRHPSDAARASAIDAQHRAEFDELLTWFTPELPPGSGEVPEFGAATVVATNGALWHDDIEEELLGWPSVRSGAAELGLDFATRKSKHRLAYRQAIAKGTLQDLPSSLALLMEALWHFASPR